MTVSSPAGPSRSGVHLLYLYRELWAWSAGHRRTLLGAFALLITAQLLLLAVPYISGRALNALQLQGLAGLHNAGLWLLLVLGVTGVSWMLHGPGRILERNVALIVRRRLSGALLDRTLQLPLAWHESHHSAATAHRIQQSTRALSDFAESQYVYLSSAVGLIGPVAALWLLQPWVGGAAIAGLLLISLSVSSFDRAMIRFAHEENAAERRYASVMIDALGNTTSLFALRQARAVLILIEKRLFDVFAPVKRSLIVNEAKWCTVDVASRALSCMLVALFAWLIARTAPESSARQTLLLGSLYMVWEYAQRAGGVISAVAAHFQTFARQQADYASADIIRQAAPTGVDAHTATNVTTWQRIDVRKLTFRHTASRSDGPTLDDVGIVLERGKRYALIGSSGSGKSTLLRVLAGLYISDRITLNRDDGSALRSPTEVASYLRATSTLIPQDAEVFEGSLAENLNLCATIDGAPPAPQEFPRALTLARASDFIEPTPQGLQTLIAERAANWSGGQRARVALARGILAAHGSALVLLDEPTASLDGRTESAVFDNVFDAFSTACLVASIHRLNLLERFDEVIVMHEGRLVAQGPVASVAARSPEFQHLIAAQQRETAPASGPGKPAPMPSD